MGINQSRSQIEEKRTFSINNLLISVDEGKELLEKAGKKLGVEETLIKNLLKESENILASNWIGFDFTKKVPIYTRLSFKSALDISKIEHNTPLFSIFQYGICPLLNCKDLCTLAQVSKFYYKVIASNEIWKRLVMEVFDVKDATVPYYDVPEAFTWKEIYSDLNAKPQIGDAFFLAGIKMICLVRLSKHVFLGQSINTGKMVWLHSIKDKKLIDLNPYISADDLPTYQKTFLEKQKQVVEMFKSSPNGTTNWTFSFDNSSLTLFMYPYPEIKIKVTHMQSFIQMQYHPLQYIPLRIKNPRIGGLIEVKDTVGKWYASTILDLQTQENGRIKIFITYEGWSSRWDEWLDILADAHRIRPFKVERSPTKNGIQHTEFWQSKLKNVLEFGVYPCSCHPL